MKTHVFRLHPGQYFREEIDKYVREHNIRAGIILTCVGNLTKAILRMANAKVVKTWDGSFEIVSVVGTVEIGNSHIHVCLSDEDGKTFGGHLKEGSIVGVTAEVAIGEIEDSEFSREFDESTGYKELIIKNKNG